MEWGAVIGFYIAATIIAVAFLPLSQYLFRRTRIGGTIFSRPLGIVLLMFLAWLPGNFGLPFSRLVLIGLLFLAALANGFLLVKHLPTFRKDWSRNRKLILLAEGTFLVLYLLFALTKSYYPDIEGTEKFADFNLLNSLTRGTSIPPLDGWFAGHTVNYYYGGHMMVAMLSKISGISTAYTHNLALAYWFAMTGIGCFALGHFLTGKKRYALLALILCVFTSNLAGARVSLGLSPHNGKGGKLVWKMTPFELDWVARWDSSRVIEDVGKENSTINEYPWFAFVHSDLHAHMLVLPFTVLVLGFLWLWLHLPPPGSGGILANWNRWGPLVAVHGVVMGSFIITNLFDFVSYSFLTGLVLLLRVLFLGEPRSAGRGTERKPLHRSRSIFPRVSGRVLLRSLVFGLAIFVIALAAYSVFFKTYVMPGKNPDFSYLNQAGFRSPLFQFLLIYLFPLFVLVVWLASVRPAGSARTPASALGVLGAMAAFVVILFVAMKVHLILVLLPVLILWCANYTLALMRYQGVPSPTSPVQRRSVAGVFTLALFLGALCVLFGCEIFHVDETYGKALQRMNTVFKFYMPVWFWFGIAMAYATSVVFRRYSVRTAVGGLFAMCFTALLALSMLLPVFYHIGKIRYFNRDIRQPTLNGMDYIRLSRPDEYRSLMWLRDKDNVPDQPVILEAATRGGFSEYGRVAANTGLLAPLGWGQHVGLYRNEVKTDDNGNRIPVTYREVDQRVADVGSIYSAPNLELVKPLLDKYGVNYIYVGYIERRDYKEAVNKFEELPVLKRFGNTVIYIYKKE